MELYCSVFTFILITHVENDRNRGMSQFRLIQRMYRSIILSPSKTLISSETYFSRHLLSCMILDYASKKCPNSLLSQLCLPFRSHSIWPLPADKNMWVYPLCACVCVYVLLCNMYRVLNKGWASMTLKSKMMHNTASIPTLRILSKRHMLLLGSRRNHWASVQYGVKVLVHTWKAWARNSPEPPRKWCHYGWNKHMGENWRITDS